MSERQLEVITKGGVDSDRPPILLVHGAWHGAWCWEGNFLDYFSSLGWETHAVSLRGHGKSEGADKLKWTSTNDYVDDVVSVVSRFDREPILIGHSMGGFVLQKYLENHNAKAAVLLASIPVRGTVQFNLRILLNYPLVYLKMLLKSSAYEMIKDPEHARYWFLSGGGSDELLSHLHSNLQEESWRACLDLLMLNLPKPKLVNVPMCVIGAEKDSFFSVNEVKATALAYGVEAKIFPNMAHDMLLGPDWESVAEFIRDWLIDLEQ